MTLILTRKDLASLMTPADYLVAVEAAFRAAEEGAAGSPPPMHVDGAGGAFHAKGAWLQASRRYAAVKVNGNFPGNPNRGLPTIQGAVLLSDAENGSLLAILDSIEITIRRTAAASALAAQHLARREPETLLICGCGEQGRAHARALTEVRTFTRAFAYDLDGDRARNFAATLEKELALACEPESDLSRAARQSGVIVACTTATRAYLDADHVAPGAFVAAVGADSPAKSEIAPRLMAAAKVVTDVTEQCEHMGDLRVAIAAGAMTADDVHADLGAIVAGRKTGRTNDDEVFIFDSTGTALEDVASAAVAYERALAEGAGLRIDLGAV